MNILTKVISFATVVVIAGGIVITVQKRAAHEEAEHENKPAEVHQPGVVKFAAGAPQMNSIRSEIVKSVAMPSADPVNGRFTYDEDVTSRVSSPITGRVITLRSDIGQQVGRGAALLEIDAPDLAAAEADLSKAQSEEHRKKLAFDRARNLHEKEVIARKDFEAAEADFQQAQADTRRADLRMRNLNASGPQNGRFILRSPIAGTVVDRLVNPGQEVRPDLEKPLFVVTDFSRLWVIADVPEKSLANVHLGQTVSLETDAYPDQKFQAKVDRIGLVLDPSTRRVQVRCTVQNKDLRLKPEMFARVSFLAGGERKGVEVPNTSLVIDGIYSWVFVEKAAGVFEKRMVKLAMRGNDHSFVESGLVEGDKVVVEGALLLNSEAGEHAQ